MNIASSSGAGDVLVEEKVVDNRRPKNVAPEWPTSLPSRSRTSPNNSKDPTVVSTAGTQKGMDFVVKGTDTEYVSKPESEPLIPEYFNKDADVRLYRADAFEVMKSVADVCPDGCVDVIATDPPYFLSNGGITCVAGRMVAVDKGEWDRSRGAKADHEFTKKWLDLCKRLLKPNGTIWVTGTMHVIYSVGFAMQELGYRILNDVVWWKTNPAPHLACRYFQHATEIALWAKKSEKAKHVFHYKMMKALNGGKQMQNVWRFPSVPRREKALGGHPTQKPSALMARMIECSTNQNPTLSFVGTQNHLFLP